MPEVLDCVHDPEPIADADDAHLLQGGLVELKKDIASNVVRFECAGEGTTSNVRKPASDVRIGPTVYKLCVGHSGR